MDQIKLVDRILIHALEVIALEVFPIIMFL